MEGAMVKTDRNHWEGLRFKKDFGRHGVFSGTVAGKEGKYYQVRYDDGDKEDLTEAELGKYVRLPPVRSK